MSLSFTVSLSCKRCTATLTFRDERPDWKTYDYRVEEADECEKSARFVAEHADLDLSPYQRGDEEWVVFREAGYPRFARPGDGYLWPRFTEDPNRVYLKIPDPYRYVECPICDAQIKEPE